ncbi:hypothetical protein HK097_002821, partial [Rhizophlyctis rosea]
MADRNHISAYRRPGPPPQQSVSFIRNSQQQQQRGTVRHIINETVPPSPPRDRPPTGGFNIAGAGSRRSYEDIHSQRQQPVPREPHANSYRPDYRPREPLSGGPREPAIESARPFMSGEPRDFASGGRPLAQPTWQVDQAEQERRNAEWERRRERQRSLREQQRPVGTGSAEGGERIRGAASRNSSVSEIPSGNGSVIAGRASQSGVDRGRSDQGQEVKKAPERAPQIEEKRRVPPARVVNVASAPEDSVETRNLKEVKESKQPAKQPAIQQKQAAAPPARVEKLEKAPSQKSFPESEPAVAQTEKKSSILDRLGDKVPERKKNKGEEKKAAAARKIPAESAQSASASGIVRTVTNDAVRVEAKGAQGSGSGASTSEVAGRQKLDCHGGTTHKTEEAGRQSAAAVDDMGKEGMVIEERNDADLMEIDQPEPQLDREEDLPTRNDNETQSAAPPSTLPEPQTDGRSDNEEEPRSDDDQRSVSSYSSRRSSGSRRSSSVSSSKSSVVGSSGSRSRSRSVESRREAEPFSSDHDMEDAISLDYEAEEEEQREEHWRRDVGGGDEMQYEERRVEWGDEHGERGDEGRDEYRERQSYRDVHQYAAAEEDRSRSTNAAKDSQNGAHLRRASVDRASTKETQQTRQPSHRDDDSKRATVEKQPARKAEATPQSQKQPPKPWIICHSKSSGKTYYYNEETFESSWDFPKETPKVEAKEKPVVREAAAPVAKRRRDESVEKPAAARVIREERRDSPEKRRREDDQQQQQQRLRESSRVVQQEAPRVKVGTRRREEVYRSRSSSPVSRPPSRSDLPPPRRDEPPFARQSRPPPPAPARRSPPPSADRQRDVQQGFNRDWERDQYEYGGRGGRMPPPAGPGGRPPPRGPIPGPPSGRGGGELFGYGRPPPPFAGPGFGRPPPSFGPRGSGGPMIPHPGALSGRGAGRFGGFPPGVPVGRPMRPVRMEEPPRRVVPDMYPLPAGMRDEESSRRDDRPLDPPPRDRRDDRRTPPPQNAPLRQNSYQSDPRLNSPRDRPPPRAGPPPPIPPPHRSSTPDSRSAYSDVVPPRRGSMPQTASQVHGSQVGVGEGAKQLSFDQTLALYRANAKKTTDPKVQLEFAKFCLEESGKAVDETTRSLMKEEGTAFLKKLAKDGLPDAMYQLGKAYFSENKFDLAYPQFLLAAKRTHPQSCYMAATCAEHGNGTKKSQRAALDLYGKAAQCGYGPAMYRLGIAELKGHLGLKRDAKKAVMWLKRAAAVADKENPDALLQLAYIYEKGIPPIISADETYALSVLKEAANFNHGAAQCRLAICYEHGLLGCPVSLPEAIKWYHASAENNDPDGQYALASYYSSGCDGILDRDEIKAFYWAQKAAEQKLAKAQYAMGYFLEKGVGCEVNLEIATKWYRLAAAQGDKRAEG